MEGGQVQSSQEILKKYSLAKDPKANEIKAKDPKAKAKESLADKNKRIESNALLLAETLKGNTGDLRFFCKVLYTLPEGTIAYILEGARRANKPLNYFCASAKRECDKMKQT